MKEWKQLVSLYGTGRYTVTELAQPFGVSRKTAHKWLGRYMKEGASGLEERSRSPYRRPSATPTGVVLAALRAKQAHPTWELITPTPSGAPISRGRYSLLTALAAIP